MLQSPGRRAGALSKLASSGSFYTGTKRFEYSLLDLKSALLMLRCSVAS